MFPITERGIENPWKPCTVAKQIFGVPPCCWPSVTIRTLPSHLFISFSCSWHLSWRCFLFLFLLVWWTADLLRCDVMWCDVMWFDVMWCDSMWCDVMWCDVIGSDSMWCDVIRCNLMRCDMRHAPCRHAIWYMRLWYVRYLMRLHFFSCKPANDTRSIHHLATKTPQLESFDVGHSPNVGSKDPRCHWSSPVNCLQVELKPTSPFPRTRVSLRR